MMVMHLAFGFFGATCGAVCQSVIFIEQPLNFTDAD
jgi:hypothetical protein